MCRFVPFLFVLLFFTLPAEAGSEPAVTTEDVFRSKDVFDLEFASDPQIAPVGDRVVYVRNSMDIMTDRVRSSLWIVDVGGHEHRPLVDGEGDVSSPRWSPDGTRVAFVTNQDDQAFVSCRWMDSGQTAQLGRLQSAPGELVWSPDGRWLAFSMHVPESPAPFVELPEKPEGAEWAEPFKLIDKVVYRRDGKGYVKHGYHHLFVLPADGGTPRQITSGPFHHHERPSWTADGDALIFSANRDQDWPYHPRNSELYEVRIADRSIRQLTDRYGPDAAPAVSPDGRHVAYVGFDQAEKAHEVSRLYVMNRNGGGRRVLTSRLDRSVRQPAWSDDGRGVYFLYDDRGNTKIGLATLDGKVEALADRVGGTSIGRPYASGAFSVAADGTLAFVETQLNRPADVAVASSGNSSKRLTSLNADLLGHKTLPQIEEFWVKSSYDERKIQCWLVKPPGFDPSNKLPLILEIHGGPYANYGNRFSAEIQLYAAAGNLVLFVNPRGSTGYGQEFTDLIQHNYPGQDFDDLMTAVDAVIERGIVDEDNLFVTGGSGGGILTAWVVGHTGRFRAAVAAKPVINWSSFVFTSDAYPFFTKHWFPAPPWEQPDHYRRRSPLTYVDRVTTPTMLMTGENDYRTPISESEQFYQALQLRKVPTALVRVPGSSHHIAARPSHLIAKAAHVVRWFETHRAD